MPRWRPDGDVDVESLYVFIAFRYCFREMSLGISSPNLIIAGIRELENKRPEFREDLIVGTLK